MRLTALSVQVLCLALACLPARALHPWSYTSQPPESGARSHPHSADSVGYAYVTLPLPGCTEFLAREL